MSPWKVILATLVIFCSGLVTGGLMVKNFNRHERQRGAANSSAVVSVSPPHVAIPWPQQQKEFVRRLEKELSLDTNQVEHIEVIFKASQERTKKVRDKIAPELKEEVKRLREEIRVELNPDQKKKFDEVIKIKPSKKGEKGEKGEKADDLNRKAKDGSRKDITNSLPAKTA